MEDKFLKPDSKVKVTGIDLEHVTGKIEADDDLEDFPKNGEIKQLGPEKSEGRFGRVLNALKKFNLIDELTKERQLIINNENVETKDFWFKERQFITNNENDGKAMKLGKDMLRVGGILGKVAYKVVGGITAANAVFELPLLALRANEVRQNKNEMKTLLKGESKIDEKQAQIQEMIDRASLAKKRTPKEIEDFQAALVKASESEGPERDKRYEALVDGFLCAKGSGMETVRQVTSAVFIGSGLQVIRGISHLSLNAIDLYKKSKEESLLSENGTDKKTTSELLKSNFINGLKSNLSFGIWSKQEKRTKMEVFRDVTKSLGTISLFLGIGNVAFSEFSEGSISEHLSEAYTLLEQNGFGQVRENFVNNAEKMWNFYSHPVDSFEKMKGGVGAILNKYFSGDSSKEPLGLLKDGVNYQSDATRMDTDGHQIPEGASIGRAAIAGSAVRGMMENSGYSSAVEASQAEQFAMGAGAKIGELHGKAQGLVGGAAQKAYESISGLGKPQISEMAAGPSGMSPHDLDGHQIPEGASIGRAAIAGSAARGIMENSGYPSAVEASQAEQFAMGAGAKIGELHGKAQGLVGGAAQKAYESISGLGKPQISEMAAGPSGMSPHDLDGHQIPEGASIGRAAIAGSAARGIMENSSYPSAVEASQAEQFAMAAGAKIGELHGKAQGLAGEAINNAYNRVIDAAKPPMTEMASPSGMSYRNHAEELAAKAAENIVGAHNKAINAFDSVRNALGKGFSDMVAQGNESKYGDGTTFAELKDPVRGMMENSGYPSAVEASQAEQYAMAAGAKIGELHGKAQGLAGEAINNAYNKVIDAAKPPMSEMATGPSGMSREDYANKLAAKAAENIVGAHNKAINAFDSVRNALGKGFSDMVAQGNESKYGDGTTFAELKTPVRGMMENSGYPSAVEASEAEQYAMAAGAKIGELHGKAQGLAGEAINNAYNRVIDAAKPPMTEMASPSGMSYRNHAEELAAKAAENIVGAHNKAINAVGDAKDRAAEFLGLKTKDQELVLDDEAVKAGRPRTSIHRPQIRTSSPEIKDNVAKEVARATSKVDEILASDSEKNARFPKGFGSNQEQNLRSSQASSEQQREVDELLARSRESQVRLKTAMEKPLEPVGAREASVPKGGIKEDVRAEVSRATAKIDASLAAEKPALSKVAQQLAEAEERGSAAKVVENNHNDASSKNIVEQSTKGGKSALRMKLDAIDEAGRKLKSPSVDEQSSAARDAAGMQRILNPSNTFEGGQEKSVFEQQAEAEKAGLIKDLTKLGLKLEEAKNGGESIAFQPSKEIQKQLIGSGVNYLWAKQAYQIGALEHEASGLPTGSARDTVLMLKRQLQEGLNKSLEVSASGSEKSSVKKLIAAISKDPRKF